MSFVLFEIIVPAEKEDLQNDSEDIPNSGGSESDADGEGESEEDVKIEEWNSGDEPLSDKEDNGCSVKETKDRKKNDSESKTDDDTLPAKADETEKNCHTVKKDDHSHESIDVTKIQKANETEGKDEAQNQQPNDKNKTDPEETSNQYPIGKNETDPNEPQNQQPNDKNKTVSNETQNQQNNDTNKPDSEETQNQQPNDVNKAEKTSVSSEKNIVNKKIDNLKHSQRNSKRKKKGDRFTVKTVNDPQKSNEDSGEKSSKPGKIIEANQKTLTPGKDRLGRKVQFQSQKQKSSDKSGNTSGENSGYNSTEPSGYNSTENSGYISDENSGESADKKSTSSRYTPKYEHQFSMIEFIPEQTSTLLESVKETISYLDIKNSVIVMTENQLSYKISFVEESGSRCEVILKFLKSCGVGSKDKSSISVIPVSIYYDLDTSIKDKDDHKDNSNGEDVVKDEDFKKSVKARLVVDQVVQSVRTNAALTFDYLVLTFLASLIAAVGLIESSSVVLVASMLISPLMGPILAIVFGSVIKNPFLWKLGLKNELIGLGVCIACGFLFGLFPAGLTMIGTSWRTTEEFPTIEMSSRGVPRSLIVGVLIAIPSGAGVALSVLGGNVGSLVGVAISASLLPPAVNAGMLWAYSIMTAISPPSTIPTASLGNLTDDLCYHFEFVDNTYQPYFSCDMWKEAAVLGVISLILTVVNILAILLMGHLVLRIKEVVPLKQKDTFTEFFHNDIKIARKSYQTHKIYESRALFEQFTANQKNLKTVTKDPEATTTKNPLFPNNVRMISRKKLETIAAGDDVLDITQCLNKPVSYDYYLCNSSESLLPEKITSEKRQPKGERTPSSNRKFEVVTYPDEVSKDQVREQKPKPEDDNDPSIQRELQQLDKILRKPSCISADEIQMQLLSKVPTAERDDSIEVEEQAQLKLADLFENPKLDYSQNPPTLNNSKDTSASNLSDSDKNENSQQAKCDTDSEANR